MPKREYETEILNLKKKNKQQEEPSSLQCSDQGAAAVASSTAVASTSSLPPASSTLVHSGEAARPAPLIQDESPAPYPGCSEALKIAFAKQGDSDNSLEVMLARYSKGTLAQYNGTYKAWWQFCFENNIDPYCCSITWVLIFFKEAYDKGASYGTLNTHRSALRFITGLQLASDPLVQSLFKHTIKSRPALPKYISHWNPQIVLNYLSTWFPNTYLKLETLTRKLVTLIALTNVNSVVETLSLIDINDVKICFNGIEIVITNVIQTFAADRDQPVLRLPFFTEAKSICPATVLRDYLYLTECIRPSGVNRLILTYIAPHYPASASTISRWIKATLAESGVGIYFQRHAATSATAVAGVSVDAIIHAADWSRTSRAFVNLYR